jgi:hypothetical protein
MVVEIFLKTEEDKTISNCLWIMAFFIKLRTFEQDDPKFFKLTLLKQLDFKEKLTYKRIARHLKS